MMNIKISFFLVKTRNKNALEKYYKLVIKKKLVFLPTTLARKLLKISKMGKRKQT